MRTLLFAFLLLISFGASAQSWTTIAGRQRFGTGIGLPVKDSGFFNLGTDTALFYINKSDSNLYYKYKSFHRRIGSIYTIDTFSISTRAWRQKGIDSLGYSGNVRPEWFGAVGDGTTDDAAAIQEALEFAATTGKAVEFYNKTYLSSKVTARNISNIHIIGNGAKILSDVGSRDTTLVIGGGYEDSIPITSNIIINTDTFHVSAPNAALLSKGDYIRVQTNELYFETPGRNYTKGALVRIDTVIGTKVVIEGIFELQYTLSGHNLHLHKINMVENITIDNLTFEGTGSNNEQVGLFAYSTKGLRLDKVSLGKFWVAFQADASVDGVISNGYVYENNNEDIGYGIVLANACRDWIIANNTSYNNRHFFTTGDTLGVAMNILITGNVASNEIKAPYHIHGNAKYVTIQNNIVKNSTGGIAVLSPNSIMQDNTIISSTDVSAPIATDEAGSVNLIVRNNTIKYNNAFVNAIDISQSATTLPCRNDYIIIQGNTIDSFPNGVGIYVRPKASVVDISKNFIRNAGYEAILVDSADNVTVANNIIPKGMFSRNVYAIKIGGSVSLSQTNANGSTSVVTGNQILNEFAWGISIANFTKLQLKENIINVGANRITLSGVTSVDSFNVNQAASATLPGVVTTGTQTFAGNKTINGDVILTSSNYYRGTVPSTVKSSYSGFLVNATTNRNVAYSGNGLSSVNDLVSAYAAYTMSVDGLKIYAGGATSPHASAMVDIESTTKGFLPPRMTATQASAISSPAEGLMVYVTNTNGTFTAKGWWGWNGAVWEKLNN
jgi:hypothetical protein